MFSLYCNRTTIFCQFNCDKVINGGVVMNRNYISILFFLAAFTAVIMAGATAVAGDLSLVTLTVIALISAGIGGIIGYYLFIK